MATSNGSTAIRDKILASLARYRALRIGKFSCAFWRLSSRPGLTASEVIVCLKERLFPKKISPEDRLENIQALRSQIVSNTITTQDIDKAIEEGRP